MNTDLQATIDRINSIPPDHLPFIEKARHGWVCPNPACRDGAGRDGTGMTHYKSTNRYYCGKCGCSYDNLDVMGFHLGLDPKTQFVELVKKSAEILSVADISQVHYTREDQEEKKEIVPDKWKGLILNANSNLKKFLDSQGGSWRGLTFDTLNRFNVGFLPAWFARDGAPTTPRIIVPTSFNHFLARLHGKLGDFKIPDNVHLAEKEHRGSKEIFNSQVLESDNPLCFVLEGEIDCMSCSQVTDYNFVAVLGSALAPNIANQFKKLPRKNFVVLLDDDKTGWEKAPILAAKLKSFGHAVCVAHLNSHPHIQIRTETKVDVKPKKLSAWDILPQIKREELLKISSDLQCSTGGIEDFFEILKRNHNSLFRGMPLDQWLNFGCRVVLDWTSPQSRVEKKYENPTRRMLIPSSTDRFEPYCLAMNLVVEDSIEKLKLDHATKERIRVGVPALFNRDALQNDFVFAVKEEIDAMSIEYAGFHAVAVCGDQPDLLIDALKKITNTPKIISLFHAIDIEKIRALGFPAVYCPAQEANITLLEFGLDSLKQRLNYILEGTAEEFNSLALPERISPEVEDVAEEKSPEVETPMPEFKDPNEILQADPDKLKTLLTEIYDEARKFFAEAETKCEEIPPHCEPDDAVLKWQEVNGIINPNVLAELKEKAVWVENLTPASPHEFDSTLQKALGDFYFYDFFAPLAQKFFDTLRETKAAAKNKISAFKKLSTHAEQSVQLRGDAAKKELEDATPSDEEKSFAKFDIATFESNVKAFTTTARRAHKKWLDQHEIDKRNAEFAATKKAHEENPDHIKDFAPDAPIDLVLPMGVYFSDNKIRIVDFDKPVTRNGRPTIEAAQNFIIPTCIYREVVAPDANPVNGDQYQIAIKNGNSWRPSVVAASKLTDPNSVADLAKTGALISDKKFFAKAMVKLIAENENAGILPVKKVYTQPGWHFENGKEIFIYPTGTEDYIVKSGDFDYKRTFTPRGNQDEWKKILYKILWHDPKNPDADSTKINITAAIIIGAAAGSPLIKKLGIRNPQFNLGFESGNGKTALGKFAVSYFGDPNILVPTCNTTQNFLEDLAVKLNDFPHVVDELQSAKKVVRENQDDLIYNFTNSQTRGRADKDGSARPTFRFRGCRVFTGEQPLTGGASGQGALARVFEIQHRELFSDDFAIFLHNFTRENYGFFGEHLATEIIPQREEDFVGLFNSSRNNFTNTGIYDLLSSHSTIIAYSLAGLFAALIAAGFDEATAYKIFYNAGEDSKILCTDAPTKFMAKNVNRALPDILDFINAHPKYFEREYQHDDGTISFLPADGNETYGIKFLDGKVAFLPVALRKIINELDYPNATAIIRSLGEANYFTAGKRKDAYRNYQSRLPKKYSDSIGKSFWYYVFKPLAELETILSE